MGSRPTNNRSFGQFRVSVRFFAGFILSFAFQYSGFIYAEASEVRQYAAAVRSYSSPSLALQYGSVHIACLDLGGYLESGLAIHRAEDLDDDSCATFTLATIEKLAVRSKQKYEQYH